MLMDEKYILFTRKEYDKFVFVNMSKWVLLISFLRVYSKLLFLLFDFTLFNMSQIIKIKWHGDSVSTSLKLKKQNANYN